MQRDDLLKSLLVTLSVLIPNFTKETALKCEHQLVGYGNLVLVKGADALQIYGTVRTRIHAVGNEIAEERRAIHMTLGE